MTREIEDSVSMCAAADVDGQTALVVASRRWFREGLKGLLHGLGLTSSIEGAALDEVLARLEAGASPNVAIVSLEGDEDRVVQDLELIAQCCARLPKTKWIVLCSSLKPAVLIAALRSGIDGLFHVDISEDVLRRALELILLGQALFPSGMSRLLADAPRHAEAAASIPVVQVAVPVALEPSVFDRTADQQVSLSPRERQILQCLVAGHPNKVIARELDIAEATVKVHVKGLLRKVKASNRTQAAIWAMNQRSNPEPASTKIVKLSPSSLALRIVGSASSLEPFAPSVGFATGCD